MTEITLIDYEIDGVKQWAWPESDFWGFAQPSQRWAKFRDLVLDHTKERNTIVTAGGCCGMYPKLWAKYFSKVYTFEPDPLNFACLLRNAFEPNIVKFEAALSNEDGTGFLERGPSDNIGRHRMAAAGLAVPKMTLDQLNLAAVDVIQLDVEGHEAYALVGGIETIRRCKPLLVVEEPADILVKAIEGWGYREVGRTEWPTAVEVVFASLTSERESYCLET